MLRYFSVDIVFIGIFGNKSFSYGHYIGQNQVQVLIALQIKPGQMEVGKTDFGYLLGGCLGKLTMHAHECVEPRVW